MIYLAYSILVFSFVQLLIALVNLIFSQAFTGSNKQFNGLVSVLIPARNEEKNIAKLLEDIQKQDYQNIEIIVFNDESKDKTAEIVANKSKQDERIKLIHSNGLPDGWLGKNYACHCLSEHAKGSFFLFLDADVRLNNDIIIKAISFSEKYKLGLLSIFPKQIMHTVGEQIAVPNMNYILLSLLPLIFVRVLKFQSFAAANGQFMLFNSEIYTKTRPHEKMKASRVEDIEIARYFKREKIPLACLIGNKTISCRMYEGFNEAINGFSKNVIMFFGNSFVMATCFWLITTFGFLVVLNQLSFTIFIGYLVVIVLTRIFISISSKQSGLKNLVLLVPQQITLGMFIYKALVNQYKKQCEWKGRSIL